MHVVVPSVVRVAAVGDIMLGRGVAPALRRDALALVANARGVLRGDLVTGNLECVLTSASNPNRNAHSCLSIAPEAAAPIVRMFDVLALANNHIHDFLDRGISDTIEALRDVGVMHVGVGSTEEEARRPVIMDRCGRSVAVFAATTAVCDPPGGSRFFVAQPDARFLASVTAAAGECDHVIVHCHAGGGDYPFPAPDVRRLHDKILHAGAQVVLGHHPHVVQGWVSTGSTLDAFSLGDFLFDRLEEGRDEALVMAVALEGAKVSTEVHLVRRTHNLAIRAVVPEDEPAALSRVEELNRVLCEGTSDERYMDVAGADFVSVWRTSLAKDWRAGGWRAIASRLKGVTPGKIARGLRVATRALCMFRRSGGG